MRPSASSNEMASARISASERSRKFLATGGFSHKPLFVTADADWQAWRPAQQMYCRGLQLCGLQTLSAPQCTCHDCLAPTTLRQQRTGEMAMNDGDLRQFLVARQAKYRSHDAKALAADHMLEGSVHSPIFATIVGRPAI